MYKGGRAALTLKGNDRARTGTPDRGWWEPEADGVRKEESLEKDRAVKKVGIGGLERWGYKFRKGKAKTPMKRWLNAMVGTTE